MITFNKKLYFIAIIFSAVIAGAFLTFIVVHKIYESKIRSAEQDSQLRLNDSKFNLISPLLACYIDESVSSYELDPLKKQLTKLVAEQKSEKLANRVSIYYRTLNTGHWTGVDEDEKYVPASLIKIPLLIAYMKEAETNPGILEQKYVYSGPDADTKQELQKLPTPFEMGKAYSISDLLFRMIAYSGNNSQRILSQNMDPNFLRDVYADLGLSHTDFEYPRFLDDSISPKTFSTFFRILYNASYLGHEYSQKALELMSNSIFDDGIVAGISDKNIKVANKFGERTVIDASGQVSFRELHDCGIVYYPSNPYLLCVMTQGDNFNNLETVISQISKIIFDKVK